MDYDKIETFDRDMILEMLSNELTTLKEKIDNGRIRDEKTEKIKIEQYRAFIYGCISFNTIFKDKQVDTMANDIETIKKAVINESSQKSYELSDEDLEIVDTVYTKITEV